MKCCRCQAEPCKCLDGQTVYVGDCLDVLRQLPAESVQCVVTSPPYFGLRDYGVDGQIGLEVRPQEYVEKMVDVFRAVRRVLSDDGTLWLNLGDSYASDGKWGGQTGGKHARALHGNATANGRNKKYTGYKPKDLMGMPWQVAFALRDDGWYLRQDIIWHKPNPMPESVTDRCTKSHEYVFLLSKSERYYYNQEAILEPVSLNTHARLSQDVERQIGSARAHAGGKTNGAMKAVGRLPSWRGSTFDDGKTGEMKRSRGGTRKLAASGSGIKNNKSFNEAVCLRVSERNKRSVWTVTTKSYKGAHFATFPPDLIEPCILAGCPEGGIVLDPFAGSGTTLQVARKNGCRGIGIELNPEYAKLIAKRLEQRTLFTEKA